VLGGGTASAVGGPGFRVEEATIDDIQTAILKRKTTVTEVVTQYLKRIKAYNGTCVDEPEGLLGPVSMIPDAGKVNALMTLNLRPASRVAWGFDERKARSQTDPLDDDPAMPDALETAAAQDAYFKKTGKLVGPLHGVVMAIKDQFDTFDLRTTSGADAFWANDRPPNDSAVVARLRAAGAIILAKANLDEYAGGPPRSSFGGMQCNPYDTTRRSGGSSGGSGVSVATNLVTCAIGEETGGSINKPSRWNNVSGLVPTRELVSADGMIQKGLDTRTGPICRTVKDVARILDAYAGYDPADEVTAFSRGRMPADPYWDIATSGLRGQVARTPLAGYRIGVIREYMDKDLFPVYDWETIDIVDTAIGVLADLGATIIDPGPHGALCQDCVDKHVPSWNNQQFMRTFPNVFPFDADGEPLSDHISALVDMFLDPSLVPHTSTGRPSIRNIGGSGSDVGDARYNFEVYIRERGDAEIQSLTDLYEKANFWESQPNVGNRRGSLVSTDEDLTLATASSHQDRFTVQTVVYDCFASMDLDAVVYPSSNIAPGIATSPELPSVNDRGTNWTTISVHGFPALTVPAGFTTQIYDRSPVDNSIAPVPASMPVGLDVLALPFDEPTVFAIGQAYEAATSHRTPPPDFGPLE
jgi:Asp-tRNA(Asn)/Glu-tRNA(Gln) amidotransferase A subunit family amidase